MNMTDLILKNNKDLHDAYSLGHVSIDWLAVLIKQIKKEVECVQKELVERGYEDDYFYDLNKLIAIAGFTADEQLEHFDSIKNRFSDSIEQFRTTSLIKEDKNKKAVKL